MCAASQDLTQHAYASRREPCPSLFVSSYVSPLRLRLRGRSLGGIFSSSSASLNGQKRIQLQCSISGVGTAALRGESRGGELQLVSLQVSAAGRVIDVPVEDRDGRRGARIDRRGSDGLARRGGGIDEEEVIDVDAW